MWHQTRPTMAHKAPRPQLPVTPPTRPQPPPLRNKTGINSFPPQPQIFNSPALACLGQATKVWKPWKHHVFHQAAKPMWGLGAHGKEPRGNRSGRGSVRHWGRRRRRERDHLAPLGPGGTDLGVRSTSRRTSHREMLWCPVHAKTWGCGIGLRGGRSSC